MDPEIEAALAEIKSSVSTGLATLEAQRKADHKAEQARVDDIEKKFNRMKLGGPGWGGFDREGNQEEEYKAITAFARHGDDSELKAMSVGSDTAGGYTVMPAMSGRMMTTMRDQSPMRRLSRVETITDGDAWEEILDLGEAGAEWVGETEARPETETPDFGVVRIPVNEIYSLVPITQRLLDDSSQDLGGWIENKIGEKFARSEGAACVNGNGVGRPRGFLTYETDTQADFVRPWGKWQTKNSGHATAVTADGLRDLYWALRAPYRQTANWLMASSTANAIDKLKDLNNDYIWRDSSAAGVPPTLLGRPVEFDENMPAIGAGALPIAFGDFKKAYIIVDKRGIRFLRDPYSSKPKVLFYAYRRTGGGGGDFNAAKLLKVAE